MNGPLRYYGQQIVVNQPLASITDIIQELFLWIAKNPNKLEDVDNLEAYLFAALRKNIYQVVFRKKQQETYQKTYLDTPQIIDQLTESSIEDDIIQNEEDQFQKKWVQYQLSQLPPSQKEVLYFRYFNLLSYQEIADIMQISEQVARNYAYRGIQQLRKNNQEFPLDD